MRVVQLVSFVLGAATFVFGNLVLIVLAYPTLPNPGPQADIRLPLFGLVALVVLITFLGRRPGIAFGAGFASGFVYELLFMGACVGHWSDPGGTALRDAHIARVVEASGVEAEARARRKWMSEVRTNGLDLALGVHRMELATGCVLDYRQKHGEYPAAEDSLPKLGAACEDLQLRKHDETGWRILYSPTSATPGFQIQAGPDPELRIKGPVLQVDSRGILIRRDSTNGLGFAVGSPLQPITAVIINCLLKRSQAEPQSKSGVVTLADVRHHLIQGCPAIELRDLKDDGGNSSDDPNVARLYLPTTRPFVGFPLDDQSTAWNLTYVPLGKTPADGFDFIVRPMMYGFTGVRSYLITHGEVHATWENRPATVSDPLADQCEFDPYQACGS
jgi:hypothetical protein